MQESKNTMKEFDRITEDENKEGTQCLWATIAVVVLVATVATILGFTVFKAKDPTLQVNAISLEGFHLASSPFPASGGGGSPSFNLSLSMRIAITVRNPNKESFKYNSNSSATLFYDGDEVGQTLIPPGTLIAESTVFFSLILDVEAAADLSALLGDNEDPPNYINTGLLPMKATTQLSGSATIFRVFKHYGISSTDCNITIFIANATIESFSCNQNAKDWFRIKKSMISCNNNCIRSPILKSLLFSLQISCISSQFSSSCWSVCKSAAVAEWSEARCVKFLGIKKVCSDLLK